MADVRISDLVVASQLKDDDYYEIAQAESGTRVSYRTTLLAIAVQIATVVQLTSDLTTDSKTLAGAINELKRQIALIPGFTIVKVNSLPTEDIDTHTLYLVPSQDPETQNSCDEYINTDGTTAGWELVGSTNIDLSDYYTKLEVDGLLADKLEADDFEANQTTSANPITLETKQTGLAKSCVVSFGPIQDLHGYDHPWAGDAGKNKLVFDLDAIKELNTNGTWSDNTYSFRGIDFTPDSEGRWRAVGTTTDAAPYLRIFSGELSAGSYILNGISGGTVLTYRIRYKIGSDSFVVIYDGDSNEINVSENDTVIIELYVSANYTADITFEPMLRLSTETDATFAPYSNICPISGRTEASVIRIGKNLLDNSDLNVSSANIWYYGNGTTYKFWRAGTYTFSYEGNSVTTYYTLKNGSNKTIQTSLVDGRYKGTFTLSEDGFYRFFSQKSPSISLDDVKNPQIELGNTATDYEPYQGETHTHQYSETIYGGVDDFVNGGATSTMGMVDLGSLTYTRTNTGDIYYFYASISDMKIPKTADDRKIGIISDIYTPARNTATAGNMSDGEMLRISGRIYLRNDTYLTTADLKSAMSGHQLCYELATPTTIQLSPEALTLLKGLNVISTDGDKVQVEFSDIPVGDYSVLLDYIKSLEARIAAVEP